MTKSITGVGLGLRSQHFSDILADKSKQVAWLEVLVDNFIDTHGPPLDFLENLALEYPLVFHSVGMSLGSSDALDFEYLKKIKNLIRRFQPAWISDHLSWSSFSNRFIHDLLPLPANEAVADHVSEKIGQVQDFLEIPFLIENVSQYLKLNEDCLREWDFLSLVASEADCGILLDINNVYVNATNLQFDAKEYLSSLDTKRVRQIHLAGHDRSGKLIVDNHGDEIADEVWELYDGFLCQHGKLVPTNIERDANIPSYREICQEVQMAKNIMKRYAS